MRLHKKVEEWIEKEKQRHAWREYQAGAEIWRRNAQRSKKPTYNQQVGVTCRAELQDAESFAGHMINCAPGKKPEIGRAAQPRRMAEKVAAAGRWKLPRAPVDGGSKWRFQHAYGQCFCPGKTRGVPGRREMFAGPPPQKVKGLMQSSSSHLLHVLPPPPARTWHFSRIQRVATPGGFPSILNIIIRSPFGCATCNKKSET